MRHAVQEPMLQAQQATRVEGLPRQPANKNLKLNDPIILMPQLPIHVPSPKRIGHFVQNN